MAMRRDVEMEGMTGRTQEQGGTQFGETMGRGREEAEGIKDRVMDKARSAVESGKNRAAEGMLSVSEKIEHRAESMEERGGIGGRLGKLMHRAGDALESGANYIRTHELSTIRDDVTTQIREHPFASVGVALGTGFVLGRIFSGGDEEMEERIERLEEQLESREKELERIRAESGGMRKQLGRMLGSGLSMLVARQVRNRIANR